MQDKEIPVLMEKKEQEPVIVDEFYQIDQQNYTTSA